MYIGNVQKTQVRLNSMPWFHGKIKREEAENLLTPREVIWNSNLVIIFKIEFYFK